METRYRRDPQTALSGEARAHTHSVLARDQLHHGDQDAAQGRSQGGRGAADTCRPGAGSAFYPVHPGPKARAELSEAKLDKILGELKRRGVTRQLLYREYVAANGEVAMSYTSFCERIRQHSKALRLSMLLEHDPGAEMYIDYCGDRVPIYGRSGEVAFYAEIFVATLAASGYTYFEAHPSQDSASFCAGITRALEFFGGTTAAWVPENVPRNIFTDDDGRTTLEEFEGVHVAGNPVE